MSYFGRYSEDAVIFFLTLILACNLKALCPNYNTKLAIWSLTSAAIPYLVDICTARCRLEKNAYPQVEIQRETIRLKVESFYK